MYSSGETEKAIRLFLGLLRGSTNEISMIATESLLSEGENIDKIYIDDFRDIFQVIRLAQESCSCSNISVSISLVLLERMLSLPT